MESQLEKSKKKNYRIHRTMWGVSFTPDLIKNLDEFYDGLSMCTTHASIPIPKGYEVSIPKELKERNLTLIA